MGCTVKRQLKEQVEAAEKAWPFWCAVAVTHLRGAARAATAPDHAKRVAALAARLATQLVHQGRMRNTPAADAQLAWVQVRHGREIEWSASS